MDLKITRKCSNKIQLLKFIERVVKLKTHERSLQI